MWIVVHVEEPGISISLCLSMQSNQKIKREGMNECRVEMVHSHAIVTRWMLPPLTCLASCHTSLLISVTSAVTQTVGLRGWSVTISTDQYRCYPSLLLQRCLWFSDGLFSATCPHWNTSNSSYFWKRAIRIMMININNYHLWFVAGIRNAKLSFWSFLKEWRNDHRHIISVWCDISLFLLHV